MAKKTSVKSYRQNIEVEKQKMKTYANKMKTNVKSYRQNIEVEKQKMKTYVKSLQADAKNLAGSFKKYRQDLNGAALKMRRDGLRRMSQKIGKFNQDIKGQIRENKESVAHMIDNVKFFQSEINRKQKDFQAYARGPFNEYIKAFWG